MALNVFWMSTL